MAKAHRKAKKALDERRAIYDALPANRQRGRKRPGSLSKQVGPGRLKG